MTRPVLYAPPRGTEAGRVIKDVGAILPPTNPQTEDRPAIDPGSDVNHYNGHAPRLPAHVEPPPNEIPGGPPPRPTPVVSLPPLPFVGSTSLRGTVPVAAPGAPPPAKMPRFVGDGTGLLGRYFFGINFQRLAFERPDRNVEFRWTGTSPDPVRLPVGNAYAVQWHGGLVPRYSEKYTLYTDSDDGVRVWLDGKLVIDHWDIHSESEDAATLPLEADRTYDLRVEYFEKNGLSGEVIDLYWESPHQPREFIPQSRLRFPDG